MNQVETSLKHRFFEYIYSECVQKFRSLFCEHILLYTYNNKAMERGKYVVYIYSPFTEVADAAE